MIKNFLNYTCRIKLILILLVISLCFVNFCSAEVIKTKQKSTTIPKQPILEITTLKLYLVGTVIGGGTSSFAVIKKIESGHQDLYKVGNTILGARIKEINKDKILLRVANRNEVLYLQGRKGGGDDSAVIPEEMPLLTKEEIMLKYNQNYMDDQNMVMELKKQIQLSAYREKNISSGVIVDQVQKKSIFEKIGLQKKDIILAIDGKEIDTLDDSMEIYESVRTSTEGSVQIIRNGKKIILKYVNE